MSNKTLWYWKQKGKVTGPFTEGLIQQYIILKRVHPDDLMSQDKEHWAKAASIPALIPDVIKNKDDENYDERLKAARRWADDRGHARGSDDDNYDHRKKVTHIGISTLGWTSIGIFFIVTIMVVFAFFYFTPKNKSQKINCQAQPTEKVAFDACELSGKNFSNQIIQYASFKNARMSNINLAQSVLSYSQMQYSDLSNSDLTGSKLDYVNLTAATLAGAKLHGTDFSHANLNYANLKGAKVKDINLTGASLSKATWFNGKICAQGSIGRCLSSK